MQEAAKSGDRRAVAIIDASLHERIMRAVGERDAAARLAVAGAAVAHLHHPGGPGSDPQWSADLHDPILDADPRPGHRGRRPRDREPLRRGPGAGWPRTWPRVDDAAAPASPPEDR